MMGFEAHQVKSYKLIAAVVQVNGNESLCGIYALFQHHEPTHQEVHLHHTTIRVTDTNACAIHNPVKEKGNKKKRRETRLWLSASC